MASRAAPTSKMPDEASIRVNLVKNEFLCCMPMSWSGKRAGCGPSFADRGHASRINKHRKVRFFAGSRENPARPDFPDPVVKGPVPAGKLAGVANSAPLLQEYL